MGLARDHADRAVRLDAVRRLASPVHLRDLLATDGDLDLREIAFARYRNLLSGADQADLTLELRLTEITQVQDPRTLEHLAREGQEPEVRRAAIDRIGSQAVLVDCASHDPLSANRAAAAARIEERPGLEQVARAIAKKDKAVYRTVREKLRLIAARDEEPKRIRAQCADLCERAERLGHLQQWTQDRALLDHLDRQWAELAPQADAEWVDRYAAARDRFMTALDAHRAANAAQVAAQEARLAQRAQREALIAAAAGLAAQDADGQDRTAWEHLAAEWKALEALPDGEQRDQDQRFNRFLQAAEAAHQAQAEQHRQRDRLRKIVVKAERLLADAKALDLTQTQTLITQGRALAAGLPAAKSVAETAAFADVADRLEARLQTQSRQAEHRLAEFPARVDELEALIEAGELKKADPLHQRLQAALDLIQSSGIAKDATQAQTDRLRALSPRVRDLQHWRRWGADQHREALCAAMETLRDQDLPLAAVAERLHVLRTDWKELDQSGSPGNQALWGRFHQAGEAVHERVRPLLERDAAERDANRTAREQVCGQLDDFLAQIDWERVDWRRVMRAEREVRQAWSLIGPCEARERHRLDRRFHRAIQALDQRIEDERARNQAFKQGLIERVQALAAQEDLDAAIEETKTLQRQWQTTVPARQRDENRLWQAFRAAADLVFERRSAQHQAQRGELLANLAAREALCTEALALAATEEDPRRLAAGLRDLEQRWRDGESAPLPRQATAALNHRWQQAREQLTERRAQREAAAQHGALDLLIRRAELCESLEQGLLDPPTESMSATAAQQAWAEVPAAPDKGLQDALDTRWRAALDAAADPARLAEWQAQCAVNGARRVRLCLELEVAAGVESPARLAQERLKLQVGRLAERMSEGEGDNLRGATDLLLAWYLCGPAPRDADLTARVERVRQALRAGIASDQRSATEQRPGS
ncbi:MAG TPA: DUF349 domain-containing protein [Lamprocystis sp. (in: g-proteobacteria)]|nr:DUF349 domain-containing protein [Lamprocystis sp. (in: g-proteobacteria)]